MASTVARLQSITGYKFRNAQLIWEAVQAPGSITRVGQTVHAGTTRHSLGFERLPDGNKRLAVVGDTALKLALCEDWYASDEARERLSRLVASIGTNENLDIVGRRLGLSRLINDNPSQRAKGKGVSTVTMAGTVEAIIGAVYLDGGMQAVSGVMHNLGLMPSLIRKFVYKGAAKPLKAPPNEAETNPKSPSEVSVEEVKSTA